MKNIFILSFIALIIGITFPLTTQASCDSYAFGGCNSTNRGYSERGTYSFNNNRNYGFSNNNSRSYNYGFSGNRSGYYGFDNYSSSYRNYYAFGTRYLYGGYGYHW